MLSNELATEYAARLARLLEVPLGQQRILEELLAKGPSNPLPRAAFCRPDSKSGDVLLGRLRTALAKRGWVIETLWPNGVRVSDPSQTRRQKDPADGYALAHASFDSMLAVAEQLPAVNATAWAGVGA